MDKKRTIKCKDCGAEMARSAKACPNCGSRRRYQAIMGWCVLFVIVWFALMYSLK